tara:strand:- start:4894 stop:5271 length:378 start_codon:yes stop_codon:yes gene_type:complete
MKIRTLSDKKIMIKNISIDVYINDEIYDSISRDAICKKRNDYLNFDLYQSTHKSDRYLIRNLSSLYGIKMKYFYGKIYESKVKFNDINRDTYIRYTNKISITMPDTYYNNWMIRQRNKTINEVLA